MTGGEKPSLVDGLNRRDREAIRTYEEDRLAGVEAQEDADRDFFGWDGP